MRTTATVVRAKKSRLGIFIAVGVVLAIVLLALIKFGQFGAMMKASKAFAIPPESVTSAKVEATEWQESRSAVGTLVAVRAVTVASEVTGTVRKIGFESGALVRRGQMLVELDTSTEEAQLAAALADQELARANLQRTTTLRQSDYTSPADLDAADARYKQTTAVVAQLRATIAKKTIRAPFDGRIAIREVELGQVLNPGTRIGSLQSIDPVHADFWLPQQALADLTPGMRAQLRTDVFPKQSWEGTVTTINPEVDVSTRNVRVRGTFANPDGRLRPGMFVNVDVISPEKRRVLIIPSTAILYAPYGDSVFAIEEKKEGGKTTLTARQKFVRLADRRGDLVSVASGLTAGETIVSSGAFKLRNGMNVVVRNDLAPSAELAPKPVDE
ncbi:MAG TPA: efflux RND transporter periplasmic adaptor subunit [Myxococcales bacterium]|nr:efflux RND transporter periplasmic adaptor subunit [Myxococcales bacterium]